jgi:hypothetical protein
VAGRLSTLASQAAETAAPEAEETAGNGATNPDTSWTGMLLGLRPWEDKGCRRKINDDVDSVKAMLSTVQVVWGGGAVDRDARKKKGAFLVRLRNIQDLQEEKHTFTLEMQKTIRAACELGLEKDFADVFEAPKGIPIRWKDGKAVEMHIDLVDSAGTPLKNPYRPGFPIVRLDRGLFGARDRRPAWGAMRNAWGVSGAIIFPGARS